ncbi:MAG: FAD-dependent oxidoreductase [Oligoflexia bacterium]|nr:FAD-dependent oxidoreductase [Oligoflexia bacterium]
MSGQFKFSRRTLLGAGAFGALAATSPWWWPRRVALAKPNPNPISNVADPSSRAFLGDDPEKIHPHLWKTVIPLEPASIENVEVAIVGGGMSGLTSAFHLRDRQVMLLEQADQFGGNSRGEEWQGCRYSIGAAYLADPSAEAPSTKLLQELGILDEAREDDYTDATVLLSKRGQLAAPFWSGVTDPEKQKMIVGFWKTITEYGQKNYPYIPARPDQGGLSESETMKMDSMTLMDWLVKTCGPLHPHVEEFVTHYCWSSFGGGPEELSAVQGLNFLCGDLLKTYALPGGNARVAEKIYEKLRTKEKNVTLKSQALVYSIEVVGQEVLLKYLEQGTPKAVKARYCVFAGQKFVAKRVISGIPQKQLEAMNRIRYRAYLVCNVLLDKKISSKSYELFRLEESVPRDRANDSQNRICTDVVFADWANHDRAERSVLTLYKSFPFDGGRALLLGSGAYEHVRSIFESKLESILLPLGLSKNDVRELRISRFGHALPLAAPGLLSDGTLTQASKPISDRIFFANQDCLANPCFEVAANSAHDATSLILGYLNQ